MVLQALTQETIVAQVILNQLQIQTADPSNLQPATRPPPKTGTEEDVNELQPARVVERMSGLTTLWQPFKEGQGGNTREEGVLGTLTEVLLLEQLHRQAAHAGLHPAAVVGILGT